jgi:hypothetical protein
MALKTKLSTFAKEELAKNISAPWFVEMLDVLRNTGSFAQQNYPLGPDGKARPLTEMEHQSLNGAYRSGFVSCVEYIAELVADPKPRPESLSAPFGELKPQAADPKALSQAPKTPDKKV